MIHTRRVKKPFKNCSIDVSARYYLCFFKLFFGGSQSEGPGFKSRRRRLDSSVRQTANGPCLSRLSCINEYKVFLL